MLHHILAILHADLHVIHVGLALELLTCSAVLIFSQAYMVDAVTSDSMV